MAYATPADLTAWTGAAAPGDAVRLLARATLEIDTALRGATYASTWAGCRPTPL